MSASVPAEACHAADIVTATAGDGGRVTAPLEERPALRRALEDQPGLAATLGNLGNLARA